MNGGEPEAKPQANTPGSGSGCDAPSPLQQNPHSTNRQRCPGGRLQHCSKRKRNSDMLMIYLYILALHLVCVSIYFLPIFLWRSSLDRGQPVLDEVHIVSLEHKDIYMSNADIKHDEVQKICESEYDNQQSFRIACWMRFWEADPVWTNDYWGRPMTSESSHKSWRPLSVLSFRHLRFPKLFALDDLKSHRLVNILLHAATGELVALLALLLLTPQPIRQPPRFSNYSFWLYTLTKLLFCLHPTHVEATANAANRPHLIAVAATCLVANPRLPFPLFLLALFAGLLSAETFLFGVIPASATLIIIHYRQTYRYHESLVSHNNQTTAAKSKTMPSLRNQTLSTLACCFDRILILALGAILYYAGRSSMDWLNIPTGLIRPAENPYYRLTGKTRLVNYAHVTALHIAKSWDLDWVGFSHEYGYRCLAPIESFQDARLYIPIAMIAVLFVLPVVWFLLMGRCVTTKEIAGAKDPPRATRATILQPQQPTSTASQSAVSDAKPLTNGSQPKPTQPKVPVWSTSFLLWLFHLSWLVTLFPIMGIIKIGTFVADRIVVTSSTSVCILVAHVFASWLSRASDSNDNKKKNAPILFCSDGSCALVPFWRLLLVVGMLATGWRRIHLRTWEWMDPLPLLQSSLKTCPRSAKSHLEVSKIYSGLYPDHFDLERARWHLRQVEEIDPTYCDVHYQYVHVALQEQRFYETETRLMKAIPCPFTMAGSMEMWKRYWEVALGPLGAATSPEAYRSAQQRQEKYTMELRQIAQEAYEQEQQGSEEELNSHFVNWRGA